MASAAPPDDLLPLQSCSTGCSVVEAVTNLTGARERDPLEATLAIEIYSLLEIRNLKLLRAIEQAGAIHLVDRLRLDGDGLRQAQDNEPRAIHSLASRDDWARAVMLEAAIQTTTPAGAVQVFPLLSDTGLAGLLEVETTAPMTGLQMQIVSGLAAVFRNQLSLLVDSHSDTLTGLLNRKTFDTGFMRLLDRNPLEQSGPDLIWHRRRRPGGEGQYHWLAIADIDHFKRINDRFGHLYGDEVLLLMTRIMRNVFRSRDKLFRFGGEEFVILLDRTEPENAERVFERFRLAVAGFDFPQIGQLTISIGYTRINNDDAPSSAIERADEALYFAKGNGRNQTFAHETLAALGRVPDKVSHAGDIELF